MSKDQFEKIRKLAESGNGYICTAQVLKCGISKPTFAKYAEKMNMERVAHGIYLANDAWRDDLYILYLANRQIVFSHETALMLHGLMEREPAKISVTVKAGYNASHLRERGIQVYQVKNGVAAVGLTDVKTNFGNTVHAYDLERTICDIIQKKEKMDIQVFRYALREYMQRSQKDLNHLMSYASLLGIEKQMRMYTEVML